MRRSRKRRSQDEKKPGGEARRRRSQEKETPG